MRDDSTCKKTCHLCRRRRYSVKCIRRAERTRPQDRHTMYNNASRPRSNTRDRFSFLGMLGMHGTHYANKASTNRTLSTAIGARFDDRVTGKISVNSFLTRKSFISTSTLPLFRKMSSSTFRLSETANRFSGIFSKR